MRARSAISKGLVALVAFILATTAGATLAGALSQAFDWREARFGADGWPFARAPSLILSGALAAGATALSFRFFTRQERRMVLPLCGVIAAWAVFALSMGWGGSWLIFLPGLLSALLFALRVARATG